MAETSRTTARRRWPGVLTAVLLPLLATWVLVWSTEDRPEALDQVPVAIVNSDTILSDPQPMAAGRALAASLTDPSTGSETLDWTLTDADDANAGLRDGTYYAVLTIPSDFSKSLVSTGTSSPSSGRLTLESNAAASQTVPYISTTVVAAAADALGTQATQSYLDQVYGGFNQLASASRQSAQGADQLSGGTRQLASGAGELDDGAQQLSSSLDQVATGAAELQSGAASTSTGADRVRHGSRELARGVGRLTGAVAELAHGAGTLADRAGRYAERSRQVARAAEVLSRGATRLTTAAERLSDQLGPLARDCRASGAAVRFCARLRVARARARVVDVGNRVLARGTSLLADGTALLADGAGQLAAGDRSLASGARQASEAGRRLHRSADTLADGASGVARGAREVDSATRQLASGTAATSEAGSSLAAGSRTLSGSARQTDQGAHQLSQGLDKQARKSPTYSKSQKQALATTVSQPVLLTHQVQHDDHDNGWLLGAIIGVILWLSAVAAAARAEVGAGRRFALAPVSSRRIALVSVVPVIGLALVQGLAVLLALALARVDVASAATLAAFSLLAAASFTVIGYWLRLALGATGVALFGLFLLVQVAALANVLPLETAPRPLQALNGLLPLTAYVDGASRLVSGGEVGSLTVDAVVMVLWGVAALVALVPAVRRQRLLPGAVATPPPEPVTPARA